MEGLRLYVPPKTSATIQIRLAHLNHDAAKFQLFEFDERDESSTQIDLADHGNIQTRLVRLPDAAQVRSRFAATVNKIMAMAPQAEKSLSSLPPNYLFVFTDWSLRGPGWRMRRERFR